MKLKRHQPPCDSSIPCPGCEAEIRFWNAGNAGGAFPHFYCDTCSNVYWSHDLWLCAQSNEDRTAALAEIQQMLPGCPCGGAFVIGSNPACPACGFRLTHQLDAAERLFDPHAIVVSGAAFYSPADD